VFLSKVIIVINYFKHIGCNGGVILGKKASKTKNQVSKTKGIAPESDLVLQDKIINAMANTSIILMSTMMGVFTQVIGSTFGAMASGMAEAFGGKEAGEKVDQEVKDGLPEVDAKMKSMMADLKKDIYSQMRQKRQELELVLSDPVFGVGPKIVERYDFKLPKLTQELDDTTLAQYSQLVVGGNEDFTKMFKELTEWIGSLPKPN
jgi:hypothetical protein